MRVWDLVTFNSPRRPRLALIGVCQRKAQVSPLASDSGSKGAKGKVIAQPEIRQASGHHGLLLRPKAVEGLKTRRRQHLLKVPFSPVSFASSVQAARGWIEFCIPLRKTYFSHLKSSYSKASQPLQVLGLEFLCPKAIKKYHAPYIPLAFKHFSPTPPHLNLQAQAVGRLLILTGETRKWRDSNQAVCPRSQSGMPNP